LQPDGFRCPAKSTPTLTMTLNHLGLYIDTANGLAVGVQHAQGDISHGSFLLPAGFRFMLSTRCLDLKAIFRAPLFHHRPRARVAPCLPLFRTDIDHLGYLVEAYMALFIASLATEFSSMHIEEGLGPHIQSHFRVLFYLAFFFLHAISCHSLLVLFG
jgi:hypothetical protein